MASVVHPPGAVRFVPWLLVGSGFCSLIYQTVWFREFRLIFGSSTPATAAVLSIFMGAIGVGSAILGRRAQRAVNGLAYYAKLELFIAITAALTPLLVLLVRSTYYATGGSTTLGSVGATIVRLLLSVVVLGAPTFLMGGTLPAAVRSVTTEGDTSRQSVARLYAANTFGAVAGAVTSTFVLLEILGNRQTLFVAAVLNLLVALIARSIARNLPSQSAAAAPEVVESTTPYARFLLIAAFATGFTFFFLELVWYRMLAPILGGSTFTFGLILALALLGIGIGGYIYSTGPQREATMGKFALTCALEALAIIFPFALGDRLAVFAALLRPLRVLGFDGQLLAWTTIASIVVLPAAIIAGYQFPLIVALVGRGARRVSRQLGDLYAWNTAGAILGSLAGGFGLLPLLTAQGCWKLAGWLMSLLALVALVYAWRQTRRPHLTAFATALFAIVLPLFAVGPTAAWRHSPIGAGRVDLERASQNDIRAWLNERRRNIAWEVDGVESGVALSAGTGWAFIVNGKSDGDSRADAGTMVMSGLIPAILHPNPQKALVIGLGVGGSAGWLGAVPSMKEVDVYELEPAILRVARDCSSINENVLTNPKVHISIGDARELLLTSREKYDMIFSEPSNPYRAGIASLFTRDYYEAASKRLAAGGTFVQWVQVYEIDAETLHTVFATLKSVFPHIQTWQTSPGDIIVMASERPIAIDADRIRGRIATEPYRTAVRGAWRAFGVEDFLAYFVGDERFATSMAESPLAVVNTDDRNVIEFGFARTVGISSVHLGMLRDASASLQADDPKASGTYDHALVRDSRLISPVIQYRPATTMAPREQTLANAAADFFSARYDRIDPTWSAVGRPPRPGQEMLIAATVAASRADASSARALPTLQEFQAIEALTVAARYRMAQGRANEAAEFLAIAFEKYRSDPWPEPQLMRHSITFAPTIAAKADAQHGARLFDSLSKPFPLELLRTERHEGLFAIASTIEPTRCGPRSIEALQNFEPFPIWSAPFLERRAKCYTETRHPLAKSAVDDLDEFVAASHRSIRLTPPRDSGDHIGKTNL